MRDLFLVFCLHPFYALVFMAWIFFTVNDIVTSLQNMVVKVAEIFVIKTKENHEENRP